MFNFFEYIAEGKERVFYRYLDDQEQICDINYSDYADDLYGALMSLNEMFGDIRGKHIGVLSNRPYESMVLMGATIMGKAVIVPISQYETADNIEYIIDNADIEILIMTDDYQGYHAKHTVNSSKLITHSHKEHFEYDKSMDEYTDDSYMLLYTSGTTGKAKGVILPFEHINKFVDDNIIYFSELSDNVTSLYLTVPLYHILGISYWIFAIRCRWILNTNQNPGDMLHDLTTLCPDCVVATPAFTKMLEVYLKKRKGLSSTSIKYIISGGAQLSKGLSVRLSEFGIMCFEGYGMTETSSAGTLNTDPLGHPDSIGVPMAGVVIKVIDGELCIKSDYNMRGYYKDDAATAECLVDGLIHTGDLAYLDEEGYVHITGRKKNLIILSGGENVSPEELEKKLSADQNIKECKVYEKNDRICAGILADVEYHEEIKEFISKLNSSLPLFKRIKTVEFQDKEFEKTLNGKIKR